LELLHLLCREELVELAVDFLLKCVQLLLLLVGQLQPVPKGRGHELAGLGRTAGPGTTRTSPAGEDESTLGLLPLLLVQEFLELSITALLERSQFLLLTVGEFQPAFLRACQ